MRQIGMPWVVQIFYGTLLMIGVGVLAVSLFATSFVFGFLFLLAFAGFRLFSQRKCARHDGVPQTHTTKHE